jgi:hypothetical protein
MLRFDTDVPTTLEVLDARGGVLSGTAATVQHLDDECAILSLAPEVLVPCLHWGSRVRFWLGVENLGYEVLGVVIAQEHPCGDLELPEADRLLPGSRLVRVRLFECHIRPQRRTTPRRRTRFAVRYRPADARSVRASGQSRTEEMSEASEWLSASCVDVSGGGMRLNADRLAPAPHYILLRFSLPSGAGDSETKKSSYAFCVPGHVLRYTDSGRRAGRVEMVVKFECLSVEEGMALDAFLAA